MFRNGTFALAVWAGLAGSAGWIGRVFTDEILFKNGDRISGKIVTVEAGSMTIASSIAGEVKVNLSDIKTFTSDEPLQIRMKDNTTFTQKVGKADEGQVKVEQGSVQAQTIPITQVKAINPKESWEGSVVAGALIARGNTSSENFNVGFDLNKRSEHDRIHFDGQYLYGRQKDNDTGEKSATTDNWIINGKYDYFFTERFYGFASMLVQKDRIADLDIRLIPAVGVGYQWFEEPEFHFNTEAGVAYTYERYKDSDNSDGSVGLRLAYHVDRKLSDKVNVFHNLEYFPSVEDIKDFLIKADAGVRADLTAQFFIEAKVQYNFDSTPADDAHETDVRYLLGLGWKL